MGGVYGRGVDGVPVTAVCAVVRNVHTYTHENVTYILTYLHTYLPTYTYIHEKLHT
jgi:hypothetical protein